ncbi:MAG: DinB family protein [Salinibacter sp.]
MSEVTDIEEAQADDPEALREALLGQLAYLVDEIEALQTVVGGLPDQIKTGRPAPDTLSMKELYGVIATLDTEVRRPRVRRIAEESVPTLTPVDPDVQAREAGWNDEPLAAILDRVAEARAALTDQLEALPLEAWHRTATLDGETVTLFDLVHRMTQTDAERLRDLGYRLHGAHLSDRDEPLPT